MALSPPRRRRQGWWLRDYRPGRWQEKKEQEPESRGITSRRSSRCSGGTSCCAWLTNVPGPLRAAHGTQPPKTETPRLAAPGLPPRVVARKRRIRTGVVGSHFPAVQSLQQRHLLLRQRLGAKMRMASAHARKVATEVHAQFITLLAIAPLTVARSRNSRNGSVGGVSSPPRTTHPLLASGLARRKPPTVRPLLGRRSWGTNPPLGS